MESDSSQIKIDNGQKKVAPVPSLKIEAWKTLLLNPDNFYDPNPPYKLHSFTQDSKDGNFCLRAYKEVKSKIERSHINNGIYYYLTLLKSNKLKKSLPKSVRKDLKKKIYHRMSYMGTRIPKNTPVEKVISIANHVGMDPVLASFVMKDFDPISLILSQPSMENVFPTLTCEIGRWLLRHKVFKAIRTFKCNIKKIDGLSDGNYLYFRERYNPSGRVYEIHGRSIMDYSYDYPSSWYVTHNGTFKVIKNYYKKYFFITQKDCHVTSLFLFSFPIIPEKLDKNKEINKKLEVFNSNKHWTKQGVESFYITKCEPFSTGCRYSFLKHIFAENDSLVDITLDKRFLAVHSEKKIFIYDMKDLDKDKDGININGIERFLLEFSLKENEKCGVFTDMKFGNNNDVLLLKNQDGDIYSCSLPKALMKKKLNLNQATLIYSLELLMKGYVKKRGLLQDKYQPYALYPEPSIIRLITLLKKLREHSIFKSFPANEKALFSGYIEQKIRSHMNEMARQFRSYACADTFSCVGLCDSSGNLLTRALDNIKKFLSDTKTKSCYDNDVNHIKNVEYFCNNCSTNQLCKVILETDFCSQIVQQIKIKMKCEECKNSETYTEANLTPIIDEFRKHCKKNDGLFYEELSKCITLANKIFTKNRLRPIFKTFIEDEL